MGNGYIEGEAPVIDSMPLGNYGVVERYTIDIKNETSKIKTATYTMQTASHAIVIYKVGNSRWERKIKLGELKGKYENFDSYQERIIKDIFSFDVLPQEDETITFEVILPNADAGGLRHQMSVN